MQDSVDEHKEGLDSPSTLLLELTTQNLFLHNNSNQAASDNDIIIMDEDDIDIEQDRPSQPLSQHSFITYRSSPTLHSTVSSVDLNEQFDLDEQFKNYRALVEYVPDIPSDPQEATIYYHTRYPLFLLKIFYTISTQYHLEWKVF